MNVSLPRSLEAFVHDQVERGNYCSASEVVRDGLRMLEASEHRRLLEKFLRDGLTGAEQRRLPRGALTRAKKILQELLNAGMQDIAEGRVADGPTAMKRIRAGLSGRTARKTV